MNKLLSQIRLHASLIGGGDRSGRAVLLLWQFLMSSTAILTFALSHPTELASAFAISALVHTVGMAPLLTTFGRSPEGLPVSAITRAVAAALVAMTQPAVLAVAALALGAPARTAAANLAASVLAAVTLVILVHNALRRPKAVLAAAAVVAIAIALVSIRNGRWQVAVGLVVAAAFVAVVAQAERFVPKATLVRPEPLRTPRPPESAEARFVADLRAQLPWVGARFGSAGAIFFATQSLLDDLAGSWVSMLVGYSLAMVLSAALVRNGPTILNERSRISLYALLPLPARTIVLGELLRAATAIVAIGAAAAILADPVLFRVGILIAPAVLGGCVYYALFRNGRTAVAMLAATLLAVAGLAGKLVEDPRLTMGASAAAVMILAMVMVDTWTWSRIDIPWADFAKQNRAAEGTLREVRAVAERGLG